MANVPAAPNTPAVADAGELQRKWAEVVRKVIAAQPSRGALLQSARAQADDGVKLTVGFPKGSNFAVKMVSRADSQAVVLPIVCEVFGSRSVEYVMDGDSASTPQPAAPAAPAPAVPPAPSQPAPMPAPVPQPTPAPIPAPTLQSTPAPMPQSAPTRAPQPVSVSAPHPPVDQASGPTIVPEPDVDAQRKAWEDEQVPYDDAAIAAYEDDAEVPPFAAPTPEPAQQSQQPVRPAPASSPSAANPFAHAGAPVEETPQNEEEAKALIGNIFGAGVVFKDTES